ncbi:MAG: hypothetical protein DCC75_03945 [Proteobacteria bacterium]|nr:MAG: hypothetical protein DCC75_03945 [Pseudomonadota bacterium]
MTSTAERSLGDSILTRIRSERLIQVGCIRQPPLLDYWISGDQSVVASGLYASLTSQLALQESIECKFKGLRFHEMVPGIEAGEVDIVLCSFPTDQRRRRVDFSAILHTIGLGAVVRNRPGAPKSRSDFANFSGRIALVNGEIGWEHAMRYLNLNDRPNDFIVGDDRLIGNVLSCLLQDETVDAAIADSLSCYQFAQQHGGSGCAFDVIDLEQPHDIGVMHRKGDAALSAWLDGCFSKARKHPQIAQEEGAILAQYNKIIGRKLE